jgi:hypothetical protein
MIENERFERALQAKEPEEALRALVLELAKEGRKKADLYALLENVVVRLRASHAPENQEDAVLNVMDALTGWCHPDARLIPDESSLSSLGS